MIFQFYHMTGYWMFGLLFMILFWGAIIWFIVWAIQNMQKESPKEIAKKRYAKGEITKKEYESIIKELK